MFSKVKGIAKGVAEGVKSGLSEADELAQVEKEIAEITGPQTGHFMKDSDSETCLKCEAKFTVTNRRHKCRCCGTILSCFNSI